MLVRSVLFGMALLGGCASDIGEECEDTGSSDECVDGAICTNEEGGPVCREVCDADEDCASDEHCNGVAGTNIKSCQPD